MNTKSLLLFSLALSLMFIRPSTAAASIVSGGLLGQYPMTNCDGTQSTSTTTLVDCSGNGFNGTLVNSPVFTSQGVLFTASSSQYIRLPAVVASTTVTMEIFTETASQAGSTLSEELIGQDVGGSVVELLASGDGATYTSPGIYYQSSGGFRTQSAQAAYSPAFITAVLDNSSDTIYLNDTAVSGYASRGGSLPNDGGQFDIGSRAGQYSFQGTIYYVLFYSRALTSNEVAQNYNAVKSILTTRGVNLNPTSTSTTNSAAFFGDSITAGQGVPSSYVGLLSSTSVPYQISNFGVSGERLAILSQNVLGSISTKYHPLAQRNIATVFAGTNDLCNTSTSPQNTYNYLASTTAELKGAGWGVNIITTLDRGSCSTPIQNYNALIRANWSSIADSLTDVALNPVLGAVGASSNTTYFQSDTTHPTTAGQELIAQQVSISLNALTAPLTTISAITVTPTDTSATIAWTTDASSSSIVNYGPTNSYTSSSTEIDTGTRVTHHTVVIGGLSSCATYHFNVDSKQLDPNGEVRLAHNEATSSDQTFTTPGDCGGYSTTVTYSGSTTITTKAGVTTVSGGSSSGTTSTATDTASSTTSTTGTTEVACPAGDRFSTVTGQRCTTYITSSGSTTSPSNQSTYTFTGDLTLDSTGTDVQLLQQFLNAHGYTVSTAGPGSPNNESTYFGTKTRAALMRYQYANNIKPVSGYFGPLTRAVVNGSI